LVFSLIYHDSLSCRRTVCVSGFWAGWEKASEPKKLEARKMLLEAADSQKSTARFVGQFLC